MMIICIVGPSGIGKTKLSIMLAKKYNAPILNTDSTQVYKYLNIGTAKVTSEEMSGVKHYMLDILEPNEDYSVSDYQTAARKILEENKDSNLVVVGGTGLYTNALFYDYQFLDRSNVDYEIYSNEELYDLALEKDPNIDIHPNNRIRLINFLANEGERKQDAKPLYDVIYIGLTKDREAVYEIANRRVEKMLEMGLVEEVKTLYEKYPESKILKRAIGYKEIIAYLEGQLTLEEATSLIKKNTRHYIKRQYTWFNNKLNVNWFNVDDDFNKTYEEIIDFIDSLNSK